MYKIYNYKMRSKLCLFERRSSMQTMLINFLQNLGTTFAEFIQGSQKKNNQQPKPKHNKEALPSSFPAHN